MNTAARILSIRAFHGHPPLPAAGMKVLDLPQGRLHCGNVCIWPMLLSCTLRWLLSSFNVRCSCARLLCADTSVRASPKLSCGIHVAAASLVCEVLCRKTSCQGKHALWWLQKNDSSGPHAGVLMCSWPSLAVASMRVSASNINAADVLRNKIFTSGSPANSSSSSAAAASGISSSRSDMLSCWEPLRATRPQDDCQGLHHTRSGIGDACCAAFLGLQGTAC
jgi:hypothetical protein